MAAPTGSPWLDDRSSSSPGSPMMEATQPPEPTQPAVPSQQAVPLERPSIVIPPRTAHQQPSDGRAAAALDMDAAGGGAPSVTPSHVHTVQSGSPAFSSRGDSPASGSVMSGLSLSPTADAMSPQSVAQRSIGSAAKPRQIMKLRHIDTAPSGTRSRHGSRGAIPSFGPSSPRQAAQQAESDENNRPQLIRLTTMHQQGNWSRAPTMHVSLELGVGGAGLLSGQPAAAPAAVRRASVSSTAESVSSLTDLFEPQHAASERSSTRDMSVSGRSGTTEHEQPAHPVARPTLTILPVELNLDTEQSPSPQQDKPIPSPRRTESNLGWLSASPRAQRLSMRWQTSDPNRKMSSRQLVESVALKSPTSAPRNARWRKAFDLIKAKLHANPTWTKVLATENMALPSVLVNFVHMQESTRKTVEAQHIVTEMTAETSHVPIWKQGNLDMYSMKNITKRAMLRVNRAVQGRLNSGWDLIKAPCRGPVSKWHVTKHVYVAVFKKIHKLLAPERTDEKTIMELIEQDWQHDSLGRRFMSRDMFQDALFELADTWVDDVDEKSYTTFLDKVVRELHTPTWDLSAPLESDDEAPDDGSDPATQKQVENAREATRQQQEQLLTRLYALLENSEMLANANAVNSPQPTASGGGMQGQALKQKGKQQQPRRPLRPYTTPRPRQRQGPTVSLPVAHLGLFDYTGPGQPEFTTWQSLLTVVRDPTSTAAGGLFAGLDQAEELLRQLQAQANPPPPVIQATTAKTAYLTKKPKPSTAPAVVPPTPAPIAVVPTPVVPILQPAPVLPPSRNAQRPKTQGAGRQTVAVAPTSMEFGDFVARTVRNTVEPWGMADVQPGLPDMPANALPGNRLPVRKPPVASPRPNTSHGEPRYQPLAAPDERRIDILPVAMPLASPVRTGRVMKLADTNSRPQTVPAVTGTGTGPESPRPQSQRSPRTKPVLPTLSTATSVAENPPSSRGNAGNADLSAWTTAPAPAPQSAAAITPASIVSMTISPITAGQKTSGPISPATAEVIAPQPPVKRVPVLITGSSFRGTVAAQSSNSSVPSAPAAVASALPAPAEPKQLPKRPASFRVPLDSAFMRAAAPSMSKRSLLDSEPVSVVVSLSAPLQPTSRQAPRSLPPVMATESVPPEVPLVETSAAAEAATVIVSAKTDNSAVPPASVVLTGDEVFGSVAVAVTPAAPIVASVAPAISTSVAATKATASVATVAAPVAAAHVAVAPVAAAPAAVAPVAAARVAVAPVAAARVAVAPVAAARVAVAPLAAVPVAVAPVAAARVAVAPVAAAPAASVRVAAAPAAVAPVAVAPVAVAPVAVAPVASALVAAAAAAPAGPVAPVAATAAAAHAAPVASKARASTAASVAPGSTNTSIGASQSTAAVPMATGATGTAAVSAVSIAPVDEVPVPVAASAASTVSGANSATKPVASVPAPSAPAATKPTPSAQPATGTLAQKSDAIARPAAPVSSSPNKSAFSATAPPALGRVIRSPAMPAVVSAEPTVHDSASNRDSASDNESETEDATPQSANPAALKSPTFDDNDEAPTVDDVDEPVIASASEVLALLPVRDVQVRAGAAGPEVSVTVTKPHAHGNICNNKYCGACRGKRERAALENKLQELSEQFPQVPVWRVLDKNSTISQQSPRVFVQMPVRRAGATARAVSPIVAGPYSSYPHPPRPELMHLITAAVEVPPAIQADSQPGGPVEV